MKTSSLKKRAHAKMAKRGRKPLLKTRSTAALSPLQKARAAKKALRAKLTALKAEFKAKLLQATETAYAKAQQNLLHLQQKKEQAKQKMLAAAEAKFEKKLLGQLKKPGKRGRKPRMQMEPATLHLPKRRGRPPKQK